MSALIRIAKWLDSQEFQDFRLWEFSLRNATRLFPWYFLIRVLLRHPFSSYRGLCNYKNMVRRSQDKELFGSCNLEDMTDNFRHETKLPKRFLIAAGFCMKPLDEERKKCVCPSGHFNHKCYIVESPKLLKQDPKAWRSPCNNCAIGALAHLGSEVDADFYIMTSAVDIARDLYIPAIRRINKYFGIFLLCPYSAEAFTFGLAISGIQGAVITFCKGACQTHEDFTNADVGIKDQQTFIRQEDLNRLYDQLAMLTDSVNNNEVDVL